MHYYRRTTQVPNSLFDTYLQTLGHAELKVLLVIIRQTVGYLHPRDSTKRKERDWISQKFFQNRTGLSNRAVSTAIASLIGKGLILVTNRKGNILHSTEARRGTSRLYYTSTLVLVQKLHKNSEVLDKRAVKSVHTTKLKGTKLYCEKSSQQTQFFTDTQRIAQIQQHKENRHP